MYRAFTAVSVGAVETVDHGTLAMSIPLDTKGSVHRASEAISGIHPCLYEGQWTPSGPGRHAALLRGHRPERSPDGAQPGTPGTAAPHRGADPKHRGARGAGSASLLAPTGQIQSIKTSVQRYQGGADHCTAQSTPRVASLRVVIGFTAMRSPAPPRDRRRIGNRPRPAQAPGYTGGTNVWSVIGGRTYAPASVRFGSEIGSGVRSS